MTKDTVRGKYTHENSKQIGTEMLNIKLLESPVYWKKTMSKENHFGEVRLNTWHMTHAYHIVTLRKKH
jgi:hypothetical protein